MSEIEEWKPGSFTKNFSWGRDGLVRLHEALRLGFDGEVKDVPRAIFRARIKAANRGPDYIPLNFFLFNRPVDGVDHVVADELVFQAITSRHSSRFDKLALFAFNFSYVGRWSGSRPEQSRPALWAQYYIRDRVARQFNWNTSLVNADDIEQFVTSDPRYHAKGARKLATNLNYLYQIGRLRDLGGVRLDRWWVDALFLALDRLIEDRTLRGVDSAESQFASLLAQSNFADVSGRRSLEKDLATRHLVRLYVECGSRERFSPEHVEERTKVRLPDLQWFLANDSRPEGAVHPTNPNILKSIPRACAMLARYAGFEVIDADELEAFSAEEFIRRHTRSALKKLSDNNVTPTMTAEELMRVTRDQ